MSSTSAHTLVLGSLAVPDASKGYLYSRARFYRFTIYDNGEKVREYVPRVVNGVAGLYDLVNGGDLLTANGLTVGGRGYNGAEEWAVLPQGGKLTKSDGTKVLSAVAVGARSYKWAKNGEAISGGESGNLTVEWEKGGATDVYTVTPVYDVFGTETDGAAVSAMVENVQQGMIIIFK